VTEHHPYVVNNTTCIQYTQINAIRLDQDKLILCVYWKSQA